MDGIVRTAFGFTLIELMIAMVVGMVVLFAIYEVFTVQNKILGTQDNIVDLQQNARMAMDMMTRDIKMTGYYPNSAGAYPKCTGTRPTPTTTPCVGILNAADNLYQFNMDTTDTGGTGSADGLTDGPNETITYGLYTSSGVQCLGRKSSAAASYQPVVEYVQTLSFAYLDGTGTATTNLADIRRVEVTLITRAAQRDPTYPDNGGYRTATLRSQVFLRNTALGSSTTATTTTATTAATTTTTTTATTSATTTTSTMTTSTTTSTTTSSTTTTIAAGPVPPTIANVTPTPGTSGSPASVTKGTSVTFCADITNPTSGVASVTLLQSGDTSATRTTTKTGDRYCSTFTVPSGNGKAVNIRYVVVDGSGNSSTSSTYYYETAN